MATPRMFFGCPWEPSNVEDKAVYETELSDVLEIMRPKASPFPLVRIGGAQDGAYLLPDDLAGVEVCFSPGVSNRKTFEDQLSAEYGVVCHMCDYSSDESQFATPLVKGKQTFDKLWLEPAPSPDRIDLKSWVRKYYPDEVDDMLLQMDIEGAEYRNILSTDAETLARFRILAVELHGLGQLAVPGVVHEVFHPFFTKIGAGFTCVHIHPNNYGHEVRLGNRNISVPDTTELTFLSTARMQGAGATLPVLLPHPLDILNRPRGAPIVLSEFWCGGARPIESRIKMLEDEVSHQRLKNAELSASSRKAVMNVLRVAARGASLACAPFSDDDDLAKAALCDLQEVAAARPFLLTSSFAGPRYGRVAAHAKAFFFHTQIGINEAVTIDLEHTREIRAVMLANRLDACFDRASVLLLTLALDADFKQGVHEYHLDLPPGFTTGDDLRALAPTPPVPARYVRVISPLPSALHLSELRVYASVPGGES